MDKTEHTPGPWNVTAIGNNYDHHGIYADEGPCAQGTDICNTVYGAANARLIAAAPELLAALEQIAEHEYRADRRHRGMVDVEEVETLRRIARAALALVEKGA